MKELLASFAASIDLLAEALQAEETILHRDGTIQRFEFTVELAWKTVQKFLRTQEIVCQSPKSCMREAFVQGLVADDPVWIEMFEDRNLTAHTYDEETAKRVYKRLPRYMPVLRALKESLVAHAGK